MEEDKSKLLAGCIILYNPTIAVAKNIESYLPFLDILYVIDNSESPDTDLEKKIELLGSRIKYIANYKNIGVASALNLGARLAFECNYRWLLTMDQDSRLSGELFFDLWSKYIDQNKETGLVAASYTTEYDRWQKNFSTQFNEIHFAVTSGNIINLKAWKKVGGYEDKLFIDEVDHDYCLKLRKNGYKILISKEILMEHMIGEVYEQGDNKLKRKGRFTLHNPIRYYYMSRNVLFLCSKYFFVDFKFVLARGYYLLKVLIKILLFYPDKKTYLSRFFEGVKDFGLSRYNQYGSAEKEAGIHG
ncbi:rhamnosyltransferase [Mucilaginibacter frigoritolerans]|uniref:Rhamnosyltransferase n=1 Tax=Mucilaginibacter frigoritolerans TaxID=652788 RepID=A0A562TQZ9_9SPHI|nr:glycosyltransferase [Mucilaginibacter frigoritolerans]TWI95624.1 rhamnosyltransferase [Mucilaginibacter frigoritolerans]